MTDAAHELFAGHGCGAPTLQSTVNTVRRSSSQASATNIADRPGHRADHLLHPQRAAGQDPAGQDSQDLAARETRAKQAVRQNSLICTAQAARRQAAYAAQIGGNARVLLNHPCHLA
jgi:hypothetical protein